MNRTEELKNEIDTTQKIVDKHNYEYCKGFNEDCEWGEIWTCMTGYNADLKLDRLKAELKGRQEMREEIREWLSNDHNITADIDLDEFDRKFKGEKE